MEKIYNDNDIIIDLNDPDVIQAIWEKGVVVEGYNSSLYRQDAAGAWMARDAYADKNRELGWEIDHIYPKSKGGMNHFINLRPMNWKNNLSKKDNYPDYIAAFTAKDNKNVNTNTPCKVNDDLQLKLKEIYDI